MTAAVNVLALLGASPAVVTETLYALLRDEPGLEIRELRLIGTRLAAQRRTDGSALELVRQHARELADSLSVSDVTRAALADPPFRAIAKGKHELSDIRNTLEAEAAMEFLFDEVRRLTTGDMPPLVASVAGGRKTMSAAVVGALQILGRSSDRLVHVLVSDPAAENPAHQFFYPREMTSQPVGHSPLDHSKVDITLSELVYVPVRALLPAPILELAGFAKAREFAAGALQWSREPPSVELHANERTLVFAERFRVELTARQFVFVWEYARRKAEAGCGACSPDGFGCDLCRVPDEHFAERAQLLKQRISSYQKRESVKIFDHLTGSHKARNKALGDLLGELPRVLGDSLRNTPVASAGSRFGVKKAASSRFRCLSYPGSITCFGFDATEAR